MPTLDQLQRGQRATVTAVPGDDAISQRLLEMESFLHETLRKFRLRKRGKGEPKRAPVATAPARATAGSR